MRTADLRRFAIEAVLIDEFSEVEQILEAVSSFAHRRNVFVSGSAREYGSLGKDKMEDLSRVLGQRLIKEGYNLVSGFGVGIGEYCVVEALKALYYVRKGSENERVIVRPFPRAQNAAVQQQELNLRHREDLISRSGAVVFIAGNRASPGTGVIEPSSGAREEFRIAKRLKRFIIPIATTGYVAEEIWNEVMNNMEDFYPDIAVRDQMRRLADPALSMADLVEAVIEIIRLTVKSREL
ncbi:MAG TPA: hypothetical protein VF173_23440 [Thermoanaerobaculia bacterium]|nr:hypothetical protein [Thermoanaerobaculia bacterium]